MLLVVVGRVIGIVITISLIHPLIIVGAVVAGVDGMVVVVVIAAAVVVCGGVVGCCVFVGVCLFG